MSDLMLPDVAITISFFGGSLPGTGGYAGMR